MLSLWSLIVCVTRALLLWCFTIRACLRTGISSSLLISGALQTAALIDDLIFKLVLLVTAIQRRAPGFRIDRLAAVAIVLDSPDRLAINLSENHFTVGETPSGAVAEHDGIFGHTLLHESGLIVLHLDSVLRDHVAGVLALDWFFFCVHKISIGFNL